MDSFSLNSNSETPTSSARWTDKFEELARLNPEQTAVISGTHSLTYRELSESSSRIANHLRTFGIGPGSFVGLGLHRCLELPAALLGILKSGAAYVPLDPGYPAARIAQMISSSKLAFVLTQECLSDRYPKVTAICIDREAITQTPLDRLPLGVGENDLMYAIFTSGSTGVPKAASVFHRGFENLLQWYSDELGLGPCDRTLIISSPSFDLTQKNFFAPLITGGTLILDDCQTYDITRISSLIRQHGVTLINCTPSAFYPLIDAAASSGYEALSSLRYAVLGGEPISVSRIRAWLEHPSCIAEVVNTYGPTECTDICSYYRLHKGNLDDYPFVPLGGEIPNVQISIRDEFLTPVSQGEVGEIYISGAAIGGGYLYDPERTAVAFNNSLYRTGDLAKRHPSNILEFRGRADNQVKINGFRIELGEIESAINQHEEVREGVVIASQNRLIAYIQGTAEVAALRKHLSDKLPAFMVPAEFRFVESFPLTPNGKIDRLALAKSGEHGQSPAHSGTSVQSKILALWSEVLERKITDAYANFFDLGGTSIHVAIIHVRLMEMFGRKFPITELFALPSAHATADFFSPNGVPVATNAAQDRARLAQAGISRFRRPIPQ